MKRKYLIWLPIVFIGIISLRLMKTSNAMLDEETINRIVSGTLPLTYELFDAVGDGVTNDYEAIYNTHKFANDLLIERGVDITVMGGNNKTYYISNGDSPIDIITDVNFNGSTFIIDDYVDENNDGENDIDTTKSLFRVTSPMAYSGNSYLELVDYLSEDFVLGTEDGLDNSYDIYGYVVNSDEYYENDIISDAFDESTYWGVVVSNRNKQYIRTGSNEDNGEYQTEVLVYDSYEGEFITDFDWEYDDIVSLKVFPISNETLVIENGKFITRTNNVVYKTSEKSEYSNRNFFINYVGNVKFDHISHEVDENAHPFTSEYQSKNGNLYLGFIKLDSACEVTLNEVKLAPRTYTNIYKNGTEITSGNGTYDLMINRAVNIYLDKVSYSCDGDEQSCYKENMLDDTKWGVMASNYVKNLFIMNSKLNRVDAHKGVTNLFIKDSTIGSKGITLIGKSYAYIEDVIFDGSTSMINLRNDYGSSFDGYITMKNVTYKVGNNGYPNIIFSDNKQNHNYGYRSYFPGIYIDGINIDTSNCVDLKYLSVVRLAKNILNTTDFSNQDALYYFKDDWSINNVSITEGSIIKLFPDDFSNVEGNLLASSYYVDNGDPLIVGLSLDPKIIVSENVMNAPDGKFGFLDVVPQVPVYIEFFNDLMNIMSDIKMFDGVRVGDFGSLTDIIDENILGIYFIKDSYENIMNRVNKAYYSEDISYNSRSAKMWLEKVENSDSLFNLYVGSHEDIYLNENASGMFLFFSELETIDFSNLKFDRLEEANFMFAGSDKLVNVDLNKLLEATNLKSAYGLISGCDSLYYANDELYAIEILKPDGIDVRIFDLTFDNEYTFYDSLGNVKTSGKIVTGDYTYEYNDEDVPLFIPFGVKGDTTGDGEFNIPDVARAYAHVRGTNLFPNGGFIAAGDVVSDNEVLINDVAKLYADVRKNS